MVVVHFNPQKREFSLLLNIEPGAGRGRKKRGKKATFLTLLTIIVGYYSTIMSFYHIRSREQAKYEAVIHCSVLV